MALNTDFSLGDTIVLACSRARVDIEHVKLLLVLLFNLLTYCRYICICILCTVLLS